MKKQAKEANLQMLRELHEPRKDAIRLRLSEFASVSPSEYFYELIYCLLTPQSSAEHAEKAISALRSLQFESTPVDPEPVLRQKTSYIRFHKTKAKHLLRVKEEYPKIAAVLANGTVPLDLREWLAKNVLGMGYKEATHFLRNIGRNGGLTILDRHILRNLMRFDVIRSIPKSLSPRHYHTIEKKFQRFADRIGIPVDELDLLFWSMETGEIRK